MIVLQNMYSTNIMYNESCCLVVIASYVRIDGTDGWLIAVEVNAVL